MSTPSASRVLGATALTAAVIGFSLTGIWVRLLIAMDPLAVTAGRVSVAFLVVAPAVLGSAAERANAATHLRSPRVHLLAVRMTAFFVVAVAAFQVAPVSLVVLMVGIAPAWILLLERASGRSLDPRAVLGVVLALLGAAIALVPSVWAALRGAEGAGPAALGALGAAVAGFLNATYVFDRSRMAQNGNAPSAVLLAGITAFWGLGLFAVAPFTRMGALLPATSFEWGALAALGIISTAAPLWGLATASRMLPPLLVSFAGPLLPFVAALAAWVFLGEAPPPAFAIGAPLVAVGIAIGQAGAR